MENQAPKKGLATPEGQPTSKSINELDCRTSADHPTASLDISGESVAPELALDVLCQAHSVTSAELHAALIAAIVEMFPGAKRTGFPEEFRTTVGEDLCADVRPDAYVIDQPRRGIVLYEVEITSPISQAKRERLAQASWQANAAGWTFLVIEVDRHGRSRGYCPSLRDIEATVARIQDARP